MASLKKRGEKYVVVYGYKDAQGIRRQKWESFSTKDEALKFKAKIEYDKSREKMVAPSAQTVSEFLAMWVDLYGPSHWSYGMCASSLSRIRKHIDPEIGSIPLQKLRPIHIEKLYSDLQSKKCEGAKGYAADKKDIPYLSSSTIRHIHVLLKAAFDKAVEWQLIESNPVVCSAPRVRKAEQNIWTPEMVRMALEDIQHPVLHLAVHLAFICSLRIGEVLGLTWNDIDFDNSLIHVRQILQRVSKEALAIIPPHDLRVEFPAKTPNANSILILKTPKTEESKRIVYITPKLRTELMERKQYAEELESLSCRKYTSFNLVFFLEDGYPIEPKLCEKWFKKWQNETTLKLPPLIFHGLRHSSVTYKLLESEGDIKLVQGDVGHTTAKMTIDTYAHTQDERRRHLIDKIAKDFYKDPVEDSAQESPEKSDIFLKLLKDNPEMKKVFLQALLADM